MLRPDACTRALSCRVGADTSARQQHSDKATPSMSSEMHTLAQAGNGLLWAMDWRGSGARGGCCTADRLDSVTIRAHATSRQEQQHARSTGDLDAGQHRSASSRALVSSALRLVPPDESSSPFPRTATILHHGIQPRVLFELTKIHRILQTRERTQKWPNTTFPSSSTTEPECVPPDFL